MNVTSAPKDTRGLRLMLAAMLVLCVVAAFGGAVSNASFVVDDPEYVFEEPHVRAGLAEESVAWAWRGPHGGNWHPLTSLTHLLDVELFGLDPRGHHAVNVGLHALAAVLVFLGLARLTRATWTSFAVALLFAVHPLRVESVAWIAERKDVLSGVFFGLALLAYAHYAARPGTARLFACAIVLALGLASKPMLVTLPFVYLLLDFWPLERSPTTSALLKRLSEKWAFLALSAASCAITYAVQRAGGAMDTAAGLSAADRLANIPVAITIYVRQTLWPTDLSPYYPFEVGMGAALPLGCTVAIGALTYLAWRARGRQPYLLVGWLWFLGMLVPVIGIVQVGGQAHADRYTYLPSIGLFIGAAFLVRDVVASRARLRAPVWAGLALVACAWTLLSRAQTARWKDSRTLALHMLEATGESNAFAHQILAKAVIDTEPDLARLHLESALKWVPNLQGAHGSLGIILARQGRFQESAAQFEAELAQKKRPQIYKNLALAHAYAGRLFDALAAYEAALALDDTDVPTLLEVAWTRATSRDLTVRDAEKARRFAQRAREVLGADNAAVLSTLAAAHAASSDFASGTTLARRALELAQTQGLAAVVERARAQIQAYASGQIYSP